MKFIFSKNTKIKLKDKYKDNTSVKYAIEMLNRDIKETFIDSKCQETNIVINYDLDNTLEGEKYIISFSNENTMILNAKGPLGAVYGLLFISKEFLNIPEFWYWMDWKQNKEICNKLELKEYVSPSYAVKYRGWFINDEVLFLGGSNSKTDELFKMTFESCLRCGGNMIIPGTDKNSKKYRSLAAEMGLAITHHHAEPLGAEMFARVYPEREASYIKYSSEYKKLWYDAVSTQKDYKVIWNLGFRGQGDRPFWEDDNRNYTDEEKGNLISEVINTQYEIISKTIKDPVCCTNMYGEVMELYSKGYLKIPENIIKVWADNGYGKMVSRRQGNKNPRVKSMPKEDDKGLQGIYYHASFYDLQASNHITMLPNSNEFIGAELKNIVTHNMTDYWIINCGSVKPHIYYLDLISNYWRKGILDVQDHNIEFSKRYFKESVYEVVECINKFGSSTIAYGDLEDEHAGEQLYHHTVRTLINRWFKGDINNTAERLLWLTGDIGYKNQIKFLYEKCKEFLPKFKELKEMCKEAKAKMTDEVKKRFEDFIELQVILHESGIEGCIKFCKSFYAYDSGDFIKSFILASEAKESFEKGLIAMKEVEHHKWKDFYANDCFSNVSLTVEIIDTLRAFLRIIGDGPNLNGWERKYLSSNEDKRVVLLTNTKKHLSDEELASSLKKKSII